MHGQTPPSGRRGKWTAWRGCRWRTPGGGFDYQGDAYAIDTLGALADAFAPVLRSCWCATPAPCLPGDGMAPGVTACWTSRDGNRRRPCAGRCRPSGRPGCFRHPRPVSWTPCNRSAGSLGFRSKSSRRSAKRNMPHVPGTASPGSLNSRTPRYHGRVRARRCHPAPARHPRRGRGPGREGISGGQGQRVGVVLFRWPARGGGLLPGSHQPATLIWRMARDRKVVLLRHAKSAWPDVPDDDRPLARRGGAMPLHGRRRALGHLPDDVVCSTARRASEAWRLAQAGLGATPPVTFDSRVYPASHSASGPGLQHITATGPPDRRA